MNIFNTKELQVVRQLLPKSIQYKLKKEEVKKNCI